MSWTVCIAQCLLLKLKWMFSLQLKVLPNQPLNRSPKHPKLWAVIIPPPKKKNEFMKCAWIERNVWVSTSMGKTNFKWHMWGTWNMCVCLCVKCFICMLVSMSSVWWTGFVLLGSQILSYKSINFQSNFWTSDSAIQTSKFHMPLAQRASDFSDSSWPLVLYDDI